VTAKRKSNLFIIAWALRYVRVCVYVLILFLIAYNFSGIYIYVYIYVLSICTKVQVPVRIVPVLVRCIDYISDFPHE
jgi:hypothetical protein